MADNTIDIRIDVEGNAKQQLNVLGRSVEKFEKNTVKSFSVIGAAFASFTGNLAAAGVGAAFRLAARGVSEFAGVLKQGVALAQVQEDAVNKLNVALKLSGQFSAEASEELQEFASALQRQTRFGDEAILSAQAFIQTLGNLDKEGLKKATAAALDLSAALNVDLNTAALLVGKAAAGEVSTFSRYGLVIKKGADNAETFANTLEVLSGFSGSAAAQVKTFSGAVEQLGNTYGDTLETLGELVTKNSFFTDAIKIADGILIQLQKTIKENEDAIRDLLRNGFIAFVDFVGSSVIPFLEKTERGFLSVVRAAAKFRGSLNVIPAALGDDQANKILRDTVDTVVEIDARLRELDSATNVYKQAADKVNEFKKALEEIPETQKKVNDAVAAQRAPAAQAAEEEGGIDLQELNKLENTAKLQEEFAAKEIEASRQRVELLAIIDEEANAAEILRELEKQEQLSQFVQEGSDARLKIEADLAKESLEIDKELKDRKKKQDDDKKKREKQTLDQVINFNSKFFGNLKSLTQTKSKELFIIGKAAALAEATINGVLATMQAIKTPPGPPITIPLGVAAAAAAAVQISTIASTQFKAQRGLTEVPAGFPNDTFGAALTSGERVVSAEQNRDLKQFLEANAGLSSRIDALLESQAGVGSRPIVVQVDGSTIIDVVQEQVDSGRSLNL